MLTRDNAYKMVGPGWRDLIDKVYDLVDSTGGVVQVTYVKEKFGNLRVGTSYLYDDGIDSERFDFDTFAMTLNALEQESCKICEQCGKPAQTVSRRGWLITVCNKCYDTKYYGEW